MKLVLAAVMIIGIAACGGSSGSDDTAVENTTTTEQTTEPEVSQSVEQFGTGGNLYKPASDPEGSGQGNMVVLLDSSYTEQFDSCEIGMADGTTAQLHCINTEEWTQIPFSCFSNGNRQTWRAYFKCDDVAEVKVTCRLPGEEVIFTVPEGQIGWICTRFG